MPDYLFLNAIKLKGEFFPSWEGVPDHIWKTILQKYFFPICDSFGFQHVLEKKNLFPKGLEFFGDWDLKELGLTEFENEIVCRFELNENCKKELLKAEFAVHEKGMIPPRNYWEFDEEHYYYEFDELYFFNKERLVGYFVNHENMIGFIDNPVDTKLLFSLDESITKYIIESTEIEKAINRPRDGTSC